MGYSKFRKFKILKRIPEIVEVYVAIDPRYISLVRKLPDNPILYIRRFLLEVAHPYRVVGEVAVYIKFVAEFFVGQTAAKPDVLQMIQMVLSMLMEKNLQNKLIGNLLF